MSLSQQLQAWTDGFFAELEADYAHRPLILAVLLRIQKAVDARLPELVAQTAAAAKDALIHTVDQEFSLLIDDVAAVPFLADLLRGINQRIDQEIATFVEEISK